MIVVAIQRLPPERTSKPYATARKRRCRLKSRSCRRRLQTGYVRHDTEHMTIDGAQVKGLDQQTVNLRDTHTSKVVKSWKVRVHTETDDFRHLYERAQVCEAPVRCCKFLARQGQFVCGSGSSSRCPCRPEKAISQTTVGCARTTARRRRRLPTSKRTPTTCATSKCTPRSRSCCPARTTRPSSSGTGTATGRQSDPSRATSTTS